MTAKRRSSAGPGPSTANDIIDIILEQPVTAEYIAAKVYRYFVREDIADSVKKDLGRAFRESGYQMKPLLKRIFLSKDFYSPPSYATQIKSPVHLVVSTYKKLGLTRGADHPRLRADDGQPGPVAVRAAERRRLGRRAHLDYAGDAPASRQPVPRRALPRRAVVPPAGSHDVRDRRAGRGAAGAGDEHHGSHQGKATPSRT